MANVKEMEKMCTANGQCKLLQAFWKEAWQYVSESSYILTQQFYFQKLGYNPNVQE